MFRGYQSTIFRKGRISDIFNNIFDEIKYVIEKESENYILNVNETEYVQHLEVKYRLTTPEIHFDQVYADSYEDDIPAEYFPNNFDVWRGKTYKKEIIQFFIPCSGDVNLLNYSPTSIIVSGYGHFAMRNNELLAEFINFSNDTVEIQRNYKNEENGVRSKYNSLIEDIKRFNLSLYKEISSRFQNRKQSILSKNNFLFSLGVPLRKKDNVPLTFNVPKPRLREKIIVKPIVTEKGFKPEPALDADNYLKILKIINDVGKNFERMPSLYTGKGEENLRDHIIMILDPNFQYGSATGETFNKSGKTDIQLRHDSSVIFIAECKFWHGEKQYLATIDQLLAYLTWRDTKASVIVFVSQKDFTNILHKIESETPKHPNYVSFVNKSDENWFNFHFHINGDKNREVKLAVQLFHLPIRS